MNTTENQQKLLRSCREARKDLDKFRELMDRCTPDGAPSGVKSSGGERERSTNMPLDAALQHSDWAAEQIARQQAVFDGLEQQARQIIDGVPGMVSKAVMYRFYILAESDSVIAEALAVTPSRVRTIRSKAL